MEVIRIHLAGTLWLITLRGRQIIIHHAMLVPRFPAHLSDRTQQWLTIAFRSLLLSSLFFNCYRIRQKHFCCVKIYRLLVMSWADCGESCVTLRCFAWCGHPCQEKKCETSQQQNTTYQQSLPHISKKHQQRPTWSEVSGGFSTTESVPPLWPPYCRSAGRKQFLEYWKRFFKI